MKLGETDIEFVRRAMNEAAVDGHDHNFIVAIRKLADAHEADRKKIHKLKDNLDDLEREVEGMKAAFSKIRPRR